MIKLFQFAPAFGLPNASPFCMKLETYLRMTQLPFEIPPAKLSHLQKAPKGKMPYIKDNGQVFGDSTLIINHLKATYGDPLDAWLNAPQRATALAFQRLMEDNLYWAAVYMRWVDEQGWERTQAAFFSSVPAPFKWFIPLLARRGMIKQLHGQGMGRHSRAEVIQIARQDIEALAIFLADKPYFMGDQPCSLDAVAYGFLANLIEVPFDSDLTQIAKQHANLVAYCLRMRLRYYR